MKWLKTIKARLSDNKTDYSDSDEERTPGQGASNKGCRDCRQDDNLSLEGGAHGKNISGASAEGHSSNTSDGSEGPGGGNSNTSWRQEQGVGLSGAGHPGSKCSICDCACKILWNWDMSFFLNHFWKKSFSLHRIRSFANLENRLSALIMWFYISKIS